MCITKMKILFTLTIILISYSHCLADCYETFEDLLAIIEVDDVALKDNSLTTFFIKENIYNSEGILIQKRTLHKIPDKYKFDGRILPSKVQQRELGLSLFVRRALLKDVRVVTEKTSSGKELNSYWFWFTEGCWKLALKDVKIQHKNT